MRRLFFEKQTRLLRRLIFIALVISIAFISEISTTYSDETEKRIEEEKRETLEKERLASSLKKEQLVFDYGGWFNFRYDDFEDSDNDSGTPDTYNYRTSSDIRLWLRLSLRPDPGDPYKNRHSLYLRLKDSYTDRHYANEDGGGDRNGPHLDYAYLTLDFNPYWIEAGRRYCSIGRGIAYSDIADSVEFWMSFSQWDFKILAAQTLAHEDNIDTSVPGYDKESNRHFYGLEVGLDAAEDQRIYAYTLIQRDYSDEQPEDSIHDYSYDSEYIGLGAEGTIFSDTDYWIELIHQTGKSRIYDTKEKRDIKAWAVNLGLGYDLEIPSHPSIELEYMFGSGDSSRTSVTNTQNGNTSKKDTNFLYFGYLPTGYTLSPALSNIHVYKAGLKCTPFEKISILKRLTASLNYFRYYKDKSAGGIDDAEAVLNDKDIGSEIDVSISWDIFSDLSLNLQYGHFMPGDAYPKETNDNEEYFSLSTIFTF
ncbi:MAG: alginate export family protein [Candidatus Omnitrophica bacterium]|nr:alginate export family protein [Candidatus Omnitrophota bacterium]